jgi:hypothetical protein
MLRSFLAMPLLLSGIASLANAGPSAYDQHVFFENSAADTSYYPSETYLVAPSELAIANNKIPVAAEKFVSPPDSLRLAWKSATGGDWRVTFQSPDRIGPARELAGDTLSLWCYAEEELTAAASPLIGVQDSRRNSLPEMPLLKGAERLPAKTWTRLNFPFAAFAGRYQDTDERRFDPRRLSRVTFAQRLDDGKPHELYIDDVRIVDGNTNDRRSPAAPQGLAVEGYERHFNLSWQPSGEADLCSYRIYRSADGKLFEPVGTRPGRFQRHIDFVGEPGRTCYYKISAVDLDNNESSLSESVTGTTRPLDDEALLDMVQEGCFRYYWEVAQRESGMALEVVPGDENLIAVGGSGFGIMALVAGTERGFVTRDQCVERMLKIVRFLKRADRFHGAFPHYLDGRTGHVWPLFGKYDNGGDLVETAFLMQGLLTARQYFQGDSAEEREIRDTITALWNDVEWDWYRKTPDGERLYWHWSPDHGFHINHPLVGWNETMIVYLLAIASPTHPVPASLYYSGWAGQSEIEVSYRQNWSGTTQGDHYTNGNTYYGYKLDVGCGTGGDLFFAQFSFLGFDPRGIQDRFTNYFDNNRQLTLINRAYCVDNPRQFAGYGPNCWGLSAGINSGGGKPRPRSDNGTICCSAALGCFPYTPTESHAVLRHFYRDLGDKLWGPYGFHDGFNQTQNWYDEVYMGLNQAQIVVGIENQRTALVWKLFMKNPEIAPMLKAVGFASDDSGNKFLSVPTNEAAFAK